MPSVTSRRSNTTKLTNGGTFAPSSIMLSRKNLDSALEKTPPKPKSSARIETWRREVSQYLPPPPSSSDGSDPSSSKAPQIIPLPEPVLAHKKLSIWRRILLKFSASQKAAAAQRAEDEGGFQRTGMWDEGSVRLGPGSESSLDYGSGSWESELGEIAGFDRFAARRDRLWRAQKLLEEEQNKVNASSEKGKDKETQGPRRIPEQPPILNPNPNPPRSIIGT